MASLWKRVLDFLGDKAMTNFVQLLVGMAAIISGWLAYYAATQAEYRNMKTQQLLMALQGQERFEAPGVYTYLDAVHTFTHDPHVYPFNWMNLKRVHRNLLIPIEVYGSNQSAAMARDLYSVIELATMLTDGLVVGTESEAKETRKCFGPNLFLQEIEISKFDNAPCFRENELKYNMIKTAAHSIILSLKCYGNALESSVMKDLGGSIENVKCEHPSVRIEKNSSGQKILKFSKPR